MEEEIAKKPRWAFWETDAGPKFFYPVQSAVANLANAHGFGVSMHVLPREDDDPEWQAVAHSDCPGVPEDMYAATWTLVSEAYARQVARYDASQSVHAMTVFVFAFYEPGTPAADTRDGHGPYAGNLSVLQRSFWDEYELPTWMRTMRGGLSASGGLQQERLEVVSLGPQDIEDVCWAVAHAHNMSFSYRVESVQLQLP